MAIDTRRKRQSVASNGKPHMGARVFPDGSFDAADRANIGRTYAGIAIAAPPIPGGEQGGSVFERRLPKRWSKPFPPK